MANIFQYSQYIKYLKDLVQKDGLTVTALASEAQVQRSYMSNVLSQRAYLNAEQGFRLSKFLGHSAKEQEYFSALIELEKASSADFRNFLKKKISDLKQESENLANKLERPKAVAMTEMSAEYYSSWEFCAIHVLVSIPEFQKIESIANKLRLPSNFVQTCLDKLIAWSLVKKERDRYLWLSGNIHIPSDSTLVQSHHRNWREKSVEDSRFNPKDSLHFTSLYSVSVDDFEAVRAEMLEIITAYNKRASQSKEEDVVCFSLDLFRVR